MTAELPTAYKQFYQGKCKLLSKYSFARANKYDNRVSVSSLLFPFLTLWGRSVNKLLPQSMSFRKMTKSQPARIDRLHGLTITSYLF